MFDDLLESTSEKKKTNKGWGFILSGVVQALILAILILIPLIYTEALPKAMLSTLLIAPPPPPPPPPPPQPVKTIVKPVARLIQSGKLMQPRAIPKEVAVFKEAELPPDVINNTNTGGVFGGIPGGNMIAAAGPAAPPPPKPTAPARIKQGGNVTAASIINQTRPLYPPLARQARIQGNVVLHAIIDKDGRVAQLEVISGHPLLVQSALDAVKQWRYKPTLLNGDPVEVDTTITVTFTMGG
ncbi:MAG TPA: TonB family protein [Verrucomicrobiae bacterium]|jgi:protein TonB|nr:TonB family protein [Verrucomicrobiae bacterium]